MMLIKYKYNFFALLLSFYLMGLSHFLPSNINTFILHHFIYFIRHIYLCTDNHPCMDNLMDNPDTLLHHHPCTEEEWWTHKVQLSSISIMMTMMELLANSVEEEHQMWLENQLEVSQSLGAAVFYGLQVSSAGFPALWMDAKMLNLFAWSAKMSRIQFQQTVVENFVQWFLSILFFKYLHDLNLKFLNWRLKCNLNKYNKLKDINKKRRQRY
mgnify:CR=1 FL=1